MNNFRDLKVWQKAVDLATEIYKLTVDFPDSEKYGLPKEVADKPNLTSNTSYLLHWVHYMDWKVN